MNNTRKKYLWKIASEILLCGTFIRTDLIKFQYHSFILDAVGTKLCKPEQTKLKKIPKYICTVKFDNKALEFMQLTQIFNL